MTDQANVPMTRASLRDVVAQYEEKAGAIPAALSAFDQSVREAESACHIGGRYAGRLWSHITPKADEKHARALLLKSAWLHVYHGLQINRIATAKDRKAFELAMESPPEFTLDNIAATFGDYLENERLHILRGLAECFSELDPAYKSHSKVKIGVDGLPKRIIIESVGLWGSWGYERLRDTVNALNVYLGRPHIEGRELADFIEDADNHGASFYYGLELRKFQNGNGHVHFDDQTRRDINKALSEFYGDVLPDSPEEAPKKRASREVSANLAFYPTPDSAADAATEALWPQEGWKVLEPSCGDGRLLDGLRRYADAKSISFRATGVEYDSDRAEAARAKGYGVHTGNFLQIGAKPDFDGVIMNPPFCGLHWKKHLKHALGFLKPGGRLVCILPGSAKYDGHLKEFKHVWKDLPVASFKESGTNIPTGYAILTK